MRQGRLRCFARARRGVVSVEFALAIAHCGAIGSTAGASPQAYAVGLAAQATPCNGATGQSTRVAITSGYWLTSAPPVSMDGITITDQACFRSATG